MAKNFHPHPDHDGYIPIEEEDNERKIVKTLYKSETFGTTEQEVRKPNPRLELGPLERKTKNALCDRALKDYDLVDKFNWEQFEMFDVNE